MRNRISIIAAVLLAFAGEAWAQDTNFASRISCELQTAGPASLKPQTWLQGSTPIIRADVLSNGRAVPISAGMTARMVIGKTATGTNYAQATNFLAVTNPGAF
jgi:hypothetical protein